MKLIFLDIDGVMNHIHHTEKSQFHRGYSFCPNAVRNLKEIIKKTDAYIVVSSTWRKSHTKKTLKRKLFNQYGVSHRIIGRTPEIKNNDYKSIERGKEIGLFLERFKRPVESFIIIDDDNDMANYIDRLVRTSPFHYGLTKEKADEAIEMLLNPDMKASPDSYMGMEYHKQFIKMNQNG